MISPMVSQLFEERGKKRLRRPGSRASSVPKRDPVLKLFEQHVEVRVKRNDTLEDFRRLSPHCTTSPSPVRCLDLSNTRSRGPGLRQGLASKLIC
jgi:hypothetical protein